MARLRDRASRRLCRLLADPDPYRAKSKARDGSLMAMKKIGLAELEPAAHGKGGERR